MKVLVCGGRDFGTNLKERQFINEYLDQLLLDQNGVLEIITGGAKGVDSVALHWAFYNRIPKQAWKANWSKYGKRAGFIRNFDMLRCTKPDLVLAFPGGKGTAMMVQLAQEAKVQTIEVKYNETVNN